MEGTEDEGSERAAVWKTEREAAAGKGVGYTSVFRVDGVTVDRSPGGL